MLRTDLLISKRRNDDIGDIISACWESARASVNRGINNAKVALHNARLRLRCESTARVMRMQLRPICSMLYIDFAPSRTSGRRYFCAVSGATGIETRLGQCVKRATAFNPRLIENLCLRAAAFNVGIKFAQTSFHRASHFSPHRMWTEIIITR